MRKPDRAAVVLGDSAAVEFEVGVEKNPVLEDPTGDWVGDQTSVPEVGDLLRVLDAVLSELDMHGLWISFRVGRGSQVR